MLVLEDVTLRQPVRLFVLTHKTLISARAFISLEVLLSRALEDVILKTLVWIIVKQTLIPAGLWQYKGGQIHIISSVRYSLINVKVPLPHLHLDLRKILRSTVYKTLRSANQSMMIGTKEVVTTLKICVPGHLIVHGPKIPASAVFMEGLAGINLQSVPRTSILGQGEFVLL